MVGSWPPRKRTHDWFQAPMPCCEQLELSLAQRESVHLASCRAALRAQTRGPREVWLPSKTTQSARAEMAVHSDSADHCLLGTQCSLRPRLFPPLLFLLWILLSCDLRGAAQGPGEWTLWGSWSRCSSSCGRGVSVRRRHCVRLPEEELCWGDSHEYRVCQLPDCPPGAIPFRDLQCSLYNGHPVLGTQKTYQWVPFHGDPCGPCPDSRGRAHRLLHYCGSDFVFQARVLGRHRLAQETRYEVRVLLIYKNRSPLRSREYVWAPGHCPCPPLAPHREYLLATRRHVSPDGTQDRLLLPQAGYARLWSPAEDSRVRLAARRCPV